MTKKTKNERILENKKEILDLMMKLGSLAPDGLVWPDDLKRKFNKITPWL